MKNLLEKLKGMSKWVLFSIIALILFIPLLVYGIVKRKKFTGKKRNYSMILGIIGTIASGGILVWKLMPQKANDKGMNIGVKSPIPQNQRAQ